MGWIIACDRQSARQRPARLSARQPGLVARGTMVIDLWMGGSDCRPRKLVSYANTRGWSRSFTCYLNPDGSVSVEHIQGRARAYVRVGAVSHEPARVRISLSWDGPGRFGMLTLECLESGTIRQAIFGDPLPLAREDIHALATGTGGARLDNQIAAIAFSDRWEIVGPRPSLCAGTMVDTPDGPRRIETLRLGDIVSTRDHGDQPVRWITRHLDPNVGFSRTFLIRAPYLGLEADLMVGSAQKLQLETDEFPALDGLDLVHVEVGDLEFHRGVRQPGTGEPVTYFQLLFDHHDCIRLNGVWGESLFVGQLARAREVLATTLLSELGDMSLPRHYQRAAPELARHEILSVYDVLSA